ALSLAFVLRGQRAWSSIHVLSLDDEALARVSYADRSEAKTRAARDDAEGQLARLLPKIASESSLRRYAGLRLPHLSRASSTEEPLVFGAFCDPGTPHARGRVSFGDDFLDTSGDDGGPWQSVVAATHPLFPNLMGL